VLDSSSLIVVTAAGRPEQVRRRSRRKCRSEPANKWLVLMGRRASLCSAARSAGQRLLVRRCSIERLGSHGDSLDRSFSRQCRRLERMPNERLLPMAPEPWQSFSGAAGYATLRDGEANHVLTRRRS